MRLGSVHEGDIVECDVRGAVFLGLVARVEAGELEVRPITNGYGPGEARSRAPGPHPLAAGRTSLAGHSDDRVSSTKIAVARRARLRHTRDP